MMTLKETIDLLDSGGKFTPDRLEEVLRHVLKNVSPYMLAIDAMVKDTDYGNIELTLTARAGEVEKIEFVQRKNWMRPKA